MKNALILHGTDGYPTENWFDWLRIKLEKANWKVWVPQLPHAEKPSIRRYNEFVFGNKDWEFDEDSAIIGHSSGAVAILGILQNLPDDVIVDTCILVGAFKNNLDWDALDDLFLDPFDFEKIKKHAKRVIFIHSDNDPYCPLEHTEYLSQQLDAKLRVIPGQKHFSVGSFGEKYKEFPLVLELLEKNYDK